jgi:lysozyme family protein
MPNYSFDSLKAEYAQKWADMSIHPEKVNRITSEAEKINKGRSVYESLQSKTNVPWYFIGILHLRESDCDFHTHLHNGDPLSARTKHVPAGRPPTGSPPFNFEVSAVDALQYEGFTKIKDWSVEQIAFCSEKYNGFGYRNKGVSSPYLWAGSNQYTKGKYISDGVFDRNVVDTQLGCMCVLKYLLEHYAPQEKPVVVSMNTREETPEEYETPAKAIIPRPTTEQMNEVSRKHWYSDLMQWLGLGGMFATGTYKAGDMSGINSIQPAVSTIKGIGETIGSFGLLILLFAAVIYFGYQKKLMKDDVQEGRSTPSGGEPV